MRGTYDKQHRRRCCRTHFSEPHAAGCPDDPDADLADLGQIDVWIGKDSCGCPIRRAPEARGNAADTLTEHQADCHLLEPDPASMTPDELYDVIGSMTHSEVIEMLTAMAAEGIQRAAAEARRFEERRGTTRSGKSIMYHHADPNADEFCTIPGCEVCP